MSKSGRISNDQPKFLYRKSEQLEANDDFEIFVEQSPEIPLSSFFNGHTVLRVMLVT